MVQPARVSRNEASGCLKSMKITIATWQLQAIMHFACFLTASCLLIFFYHCNFFFSPQLKTFGLHIYLFISGFFIGKALLKLDFSSPGQGRHSLARSEAMPSKHLDADWQTDIFIEAWTCLYGSAWDVFPWQSPALLPFLWCRHLVCTGQRCCRKLEVF